MGAKVILVGKPRSVRTEEGGVAFEIVAGPPNPSTPKGMPSFGLVMYHVRCTQRTWDRGHWDREDRSDVIVEGYQEPRTDNGKPYIAVVAIALTTKTRQVMDKANQLLAEAAKARRTYDALRARYGEDADVVQGAKAAMKTAKAGLERFCAVNREFLRRESLDVTAT